MRVIAGAAKGTRLVAPAGGTRPTTDRVREAVFSVLAGWAGAGGDEPQRQLSGLAVLDLFAGSAAVAIEAASRGAGPVVAVDVAEAAVRAARRNVAAADVGVLVVRAAAADYLVRAGPSFDIIWLDPPYEQPMDDVLAGAAGRLAAGGLLVAERSSRTPEPWLPPGLEMAWVRRYGETVVYFAREGKP